MLKKTILSAVLCALFSASTLFAATEVLKADLKGDTLRPTAAGAITDDSNAELRNLRVDPSTNALKVTGTLSLPTGAATETTLSTLNGKVTACNTGAVTVSTSALPTGAATETTLSSVLTSLGGLTVGFNTVFDADADESAQVIKAAAGNLYSLTVDNADSSAKIYVQLYDVAAGSVNVGTTVPKYVIPVPAGAMFDDRFVPPMAFATAITYAITSTATGSGAPGATITLSAGLK